MARLTHLSRLKPSTQLSLDLKDVKQFLKIDHNLEDALLEVFILGIVEKFENHSGLSLSPLSYRASYNNLTSYSLDLPKRPVSKIEKISITHLNGVSSKFNEHHYYLSNDTLHFRILPLLHTIDIDFTCGYKSLPHDLRILLIEHVAHIYENRADKFDMKKYDEFRSIKL